MPQALTASTTTPAELAQSCTSSILACVAREEAVHRIILTHTHIPLRLGVRISHEDFGGRALAGWSAGCPTGGESSCGDASNGWLYEGVITASESACNGHATHVASTAGGRAHGVASGATIVTVQVLSCGNTGSYAQVIAGIDWAVEDAAVRGLPAVISMSLGGEGRGQFDSAIDAAYDAGVLTVVAAGTLAPNNHRSDTPSNSHTEGGVAKFR